MTVGGIWAFMCLKFFVVLLDEFGMIDLFQSLLNREYFFNIVFRRY